MYGYFSIFIFFILLFCYFAILVLSRLLPFLSASPFYAAYRTAKHEQTPLKSYDCGAALQLAFPSGDRMCGNIRNSSAVATQKFRHPATWALGGIRCIWCRFASAIKAFSESFEIKFYPLTESEGRDVIASSAAVERGEKDSSRV